MTRHVKLIHSDVSQIEKQTQPAKTYKRKVSSDIAKQVDSGIAKANPAKTGVKQRTCATKSSPLSCTTCGRTFRSRHAVYAHHRAHLRAISREKCSAVVSTRKHNHNERINKSLRQNPLESESDAANVADFEEAPDGYEVVGTADALSIVNMSDTTNDGCVNVIDGRDLEDGGIQVVEATHTERRRSARIPDTETAAATSGEENKAPLATAATNQTSPLPTTTLTAAATERMVRVLETLNDEEIMQLDLAGVLEENTESSTRRQPMKHEVIQRTRRKHAMPIVGTIPPSSFVHNFGKANSSPDGMLASFTDVRGTTFAFELLDTLRQTVDGSNEEIRIYHCKACVRTANRLDMCVDLPRVKTVNGYFVDIDPTRPQGMSSESQHRV